MKDMRTTADRRTVVGVFEDLASAQRAVAALAQARFPPSEIGLEEGGQEAAGLVGALITMGVPANESRAYDQARRGGRALVTVRSAGRQEQAREILHGSAALAVDELMPPPSAERGPTMTAENDRFAGPASGRTRQLVQEELVARVRAVADGEVLIRRVVTTVSRTIEVSLKREELVVERRPAGPQSAAPGGELADGGPGDQLTTGVRDLQPGQVIRLTLVEEEPRIERQPVVYEEVALGKQLVRETRRLSAEARREVLRIDRSESALPSDEGTS
jgi:stress response protein YsnF